MGLHNPFRMKRHLTACNTNQFNSVTVALAVLFYWLLHPFPTSRQLSKMSFQARGNNDTQTSGTFVTLCSTHYKANIVSNFTFVFSCWANGSSLYISSQFTPFNPFVLKHVQDYNPFCTTDVSSFSFIIHIFNYLCHTSLYRQKFINRAIFQGPK